jgi:hypothetical protein
MPPLVATITPSRDPGDESLVVSQVGVVETIDVRGVDQRDAGIERRVKRANGLCFRRPPGDGERHGAEADHGDGRRAGTEEA